MKHYEITWMDIRPPYDPEEYTFIESFKDIDSLKEWLDEYLCDELVLISVKELVVSKVDIDLSEFE